MDKFPFHWTPLLNAVSTFTVQHLEETQIFLRDKMVPFQHSQSSAHSCQIEFPSAFNFVPCLECSKDWPWPAPELLMELFAPSCSALGINLDSPWKMLFLEFNAG